MRVQSAIADLQRRQRQVLASARGAAAGGAGATAAQPRPLRPEETSQTRQQSDHVRAAHWILVPECHFAPAFLALAPL